MFGKGLCFLVILFHFNLCDGILCGDSRTCTCSNFVMDCRSKKLTSFPKGIDKGIKALYLNGNEIPEIDQIPEEAELQTLVLTNNKIKKLSYDAFDNLDNLRTLFLSNNSISTIADDIFEWNPLKLEVLHLDGNKMEFIQHFLFYDLEQLNELHLQNNKITFIHPHAFLQLKHLRNLRLDGNKLHTFNHKWIEKLQTNVFEELRFDNNEWSCDCAMNVSQVWLLKEKKSKWFIDLTTAHPIKCVNPPDQRNKFLNSLSKDDVQKKCDMPVITGISSPATIARGRDVLLRCVYDKALFPWPTIAWTAPNKDVYRLNTAINFDGITVHQDGSLLITNLSKSDNGEYSCTAANVIGTFVANTKITVVEPKPTAKPTKTPPPTLAVTTEKPKSKETAIVAKECPRHCQCVSRRIDCSGDGTAGIPELPSDMPLDAISISLATNGLTELRSRAFANFLDLEELRLDVNKISTIDARAFEALDGLTTLTLQDNQLTHIKKGTFKPLVNLNVLVLDKNKLTKLDDNMFEGLGDLQWLYVRHNLIQTISPDAFKPLNHIKYIHIESNDIGVIYPDTIKALTLKAAPTIKKIFLDDNAFKCDDNMEEMRIFVRNTKNFQYFPNFFEDGIQCSFPAKYDEQYLQNIEEKLLPVATFSSGSGSGGNLQTGGDVEKASGYTGLLFGGIALGIVLTIVLTILWKKYGRAARTRGASYNYSNINGQDDERSGLTENLGGSGTEAFV